MSQHARMTPIAATLILFLFPFVLFSGCESLSEKTPRKNRKEMLQEKIEKFRILQNAVVSQTLKSGMSSTKIKETFGDPDDIFLSGSTTGRFEIWSYEEYTPSGKPTWYSI